MAEESRRLGLDRCVDGDLQMLRDLPSLASLDLSAFPRITDGALKELHHWPSLAFLDLEISQACLSFPTTLSLEGCKRITDWGLKNHRIYHIIL